MGTMRKATGSAGAALYIQQFICVVCLKSWLRYIGHVACFLDFAFDPTLRPTTPSCTNAPCCSSRHSEVLLFFDSLLTVS